MDAAQQIILFSNADAIIGCHGSGLVWLNFCKPYIPVIEIQTPYFMKTGIPKHDFCLISQANKLNHAIYSCTNITGEPLDPYNVRANVDIDTLSAILDESWLARPPQIYYL